MEGSRERGLGHHVGDLAGSSWLSPRHIRLAKFVAPVLVFVLLAIWISAPGGSDKEPAGAEPGYAPVSQPVPTSPPVTEPALPEGWRSYAVALEELEGLPPDAAPGTELDLWVMWEPPITGTPKVQLLVEDVVLEKIVPAITPNGPDAAVLLLPHKKTRDLLYGDQYGALSVTLGSP